MELTGSYPEAEGTGWISSGSRSSVRTRTDGRSRQSLSCNANKCWISRKEVQFRAQETMIYRRTRTWAQLVSMRRPPPEVAAGAKATHAGDRSIIYAGARQGIS